MAEGKHAGRPARSSEEQAGFVGEAVGETLADNSPNWLKPYAEKLVPVFNVAGKLVGYLIPVWNAMMVGYSKAYAFLEPYEPDLLLPMVVGVMLMLFGGYFMMLVACMEAYKLTGWESSARAIKVIYNDARKVAKESKADDQVDEDNDGIADVLQIQKKELVARKAKLFLRTANPVELSSAMSGLYTGFLAVLSTLKLQFARTIALGAAIGDVASRPAIKVLHKPISRLVGHDYEKWVDVGISYVCKIIGVWIAMLLQRILAAFHSALRGAQMFTDAFAVFTAKHGYMELSKGYYDEAFAAVCAMGGLYLQLTTSFSMPWIIAIPFAPLLIVEKFLLSMVTYSAM